MKIMKRCISILLAAAMLAALALPAFAAGSRTIHISTAEELQELAQKCRLDTFSQELTVILDADIDLGGKPFDPFPTFGGTFEGDNHIISGMTLSSDGDHQGFFRYIQPTGVIRNLQIEGKVDPATIREEVGGFVGSNFGTLQECTFYGEVRGLEFVGGIAGENFGTLRTCTSYATVSGKHYTGGVVGSNSGTVESCTNYGKVNVTVESTGIDLDSIDLTDLTSLPFVTAKAQDVVADTGGIAGLSDGTILKCSNEGTVGYERYGYNVGGIVGRQAGFILSCSNSGSVLGSKDVGGIAGQMEPFMLLKTTENLVDELQALSDSLDAAAGNLSANSSATGQVLGELQGEANEAAEHAMDLNENSKNKLEIKSDIPIVSELVKSTEGLESLVRDENDEGAWGNIKEWVSGAGVTISDASKQIGDETWENIVDGKITKGDQETIGEVGTETVQGLGGNLRDRIDARKTEEALREERYDEATTNLVNNISTMATSFSRLSNVLSKATGDFAGDIMEVNYHFYRATNLLAVLLRGDKVRYDDISETDADTDTDGKVYNCTNTGKISGETCVGGIIGDMGIEQEFDLEGIINNVMDTNDFIFNTYETRCVLRNCVNNGEVYATKHNVGGIAGYEELGMVVNCENYGSVTSDDGSCVGGIVGLSSTVVRSSYALCEISGQNYIGGIVGYAERVYDCASRVNILDSVASVGAIAGALDPENDDAEAVGNIFISAELGGIDGISYSGKAEPVSEAAFLNINYLPERFRQISVTFVAGDMTVGTVGCVYGKGIVSGSIPAVPAKKGYTGYWPDMDYAAVAANMTLHAIYNPEQASLASQEVREGTPMSILLLEGSFDDCAGLELTEYTGALPEIDGGTVLEAWTYTVTDNQTGGTYAVHFLRPQLENRNDKVLLYARSGGSWQLVRTRSNGSYSVFDATGKSLTFCAVEYPGGSGWVLFAAIGGVLLLIGIIFLLRRRKKNGSEPPKENPGTPDAAETDPGASENGEAGDAPETDPADETPEPSEPAEAEPEPAAKEPDEPTESAEAEAEQAEDAKPKEEPILTEAEVDSLQSIIDAVHRLDAQNADLAAAPAGDA